MYIFIFKIAKFITLKILNWLNSQIVKITFFQNCETLNAGSLKLLNVHININLKV